MLHRKPKMRTPADLTFTVLLLSAGGALVWAVLDLPSPSSGLSGEVRAQMDRSGVLSPITAVLLNFRGYDTLLEVGVLLLAAIGCLSAGRSRQGREEAEMPFVPTGPVLEGMIFLLIPLMVLVGGYLLWAGEHAPGGAFQAGSILGAAGILLLLGDKVRFPETPGWPLRVALASGFVLFLGVAAGTAAKEGNLLKYPLSLAGGLIVLLETFVTLSIAVTLVVLFAVNSPLKQHEER